MEEIMTINVRTFEPCIVEGRGARVVMIPFSAETRGELFCGKTRENGTDTQHILPDGGIRLSARYILFGKDALGNDCRVFIENNGSSLTDCIPEIRTDSPALSFLEDAVLSSSAEPCPGGVTVRIFAENANIKEQ